ncbi:hypothetical protein K458DRAFT_153695 [Lentithecium fluviatile CBS 122367]|uniref:Secreted protein n=1 Tax=Lentithecium fluviatile CBS 122367 TaxID=1168545 RepID=A0A6G1JE39_9PLEO|nr:hypothetical protein K458DRAFT_153695 [Lentithecium fluviatile CBS 122367]
MHAIHLMLLAMPGCLPLRASAACHPACRRLPCVQPWTLLPLRQGGCLTHTNWATDLLRRGPMQQSHTCCGLSSRPVNMIGIRAAAIAPSSWLLGCRGPMGYPCPLDIIEHRQRPAIPSSRDGIPAMRVPATRIWYTQRCSTLCALVLCWRVEDALAHWRPDSHFGTVPRRSRTRTRVETSCVCTPLFPSADCICYTGPNWRS